MTTYLSPEQQSGLAATLATKQSLRNLLRKMRESDNRKVARIADKAIVRALKHFSGENIARHYGVGTTTIDNYRHRMLFGLPLPSVEPPPVDWDAVDDEIRMGWHLEALAQSMGPKYIMEKFGVSIYGAQHGGKVIESSRPSGKYLAMATADPELRESVMEARNEYRATRAKRRNFTYGAIAERHGIYKTAVAMRARQLPRGGYGNE